MARIIREIPCLDPFVASELTTIRNSVKQFIAAIEGDTGQLGLLLHETAPSDLIEKMRRKEITKGAAFAEFLNDYLLPPDSVKTLTRHWSNQEIAAEAVLRKFVEEHLIANHLIGDDRKKLPLKYFINVEGRCLREECEGHVSRMAVEVGYPLGEQEFYYVQTPRYTPFCSRGGKKDIHLTEIISASHWAMPRDPERTNTYMIQWRLKSGGRLLDKLVDHLMGDRGGINDIAAARVTIKNSGNRTRDKRNLENKILIPMMRTWVGGNPPWEGRIEYRKIDENLNPIHETGEAHSLERAGRFIEAIVPVSGIEIGVQLQLEQWYREMEENADLSHPRYVEMQTERRAREWTDYHYQLRKHLEPIFNGK